MNESDFNIEKTSIVGNIKKYLIILAELCFDWKNAFEKINRGNIVHGFWVFTLLVAVVTLVSYFVRRIISFAFTGEFYKSAYSVFAEYYMLSEVSGFISTIITYSLEVLAVSALFYVLNYDIAGLWKSRPDIQDDELPFEDDADGNACNDISGELKKISNMLFYAAAAVYIWGIIAGLFISAIGLSNIFIYPEAIFFVIIFSLMFHYACIVFFEYHALKCIISDKKRILASIVLPVIAINAVFLITGFSVSGAIFSLLNTAIFGM